MSVIQHVNRERLVLLGWSRAILLQLAHPLVAAGVLEHSGFRGGLIAAAVRLHHTVAAMRSLTFGNEARRQAALDRIRAIHRTVHGTLPAAVGVFPAGTPYSAEDPALLLWVHATLVDSTADIYQRLVSPLTPEELDALCADSVPSFEALGGTPGLAPERWQSLQAYMARMSATHTLAVSPGAKRLGRMVLTPRAAGLPVSLGGLNELLTAGTLPPDIRDAYGLAWNAARQRRFERVVRTVKRLRRLTPAAVAWWPETR